MRKLLSILLALFLILSLAACNGNEDPQSSSAPESSETSEPIGSDPESSEPETSEPENSEPESSEPENSKPETSKPESSQPENSKPESSKPETSKPETSKTDRPVASTTTQKTTTRKTTTRTVTSNNSGNKTTVTGTTTTTKPSYILPTSGNWEKPVTVNTAVLYNKQSSSYDDEAEALRQKILNTKDTLKAASGCKTYYISYRGNDKNDGLSAKTPWLTTANLDKTNLKSGDVVLFERGGVYRGVQITKMYSISYGAYGTGAKPQLYGSDKNYADEGLWTKYADNIWRAKVPSGTTDIGNVVFDYGKICASDGKVLSTKKLEDDYDFYCDANNGYLYVYLSKGNPGKLHDSIEITPKIHAFASSFVTNVTIENLCIKYYDYGIATSGGTNNLTVRGCEIGYIGGCMISAGCRAGNGIEIYGKTDTALVENCWIYQCYDAGYTSQGDGVFKNITVQNNLIEYCPYNIEVWVSKPESGSKVVNCTYQNNILRFAGYGFGTNNRIGSSTSAIGNITLCTGMTIPCQNFVIKNNVFDCGYRYVIRIPSANSTSGLGPTITNNTWIQKPYKAAENNASIVATAAKDNIVPCVGAIASSGSDSPRNCSTLSEMKESVKLFDKNPTAIILEK